MDPIVLYEIIGIVGFAIVITYLDNRTWHK
jgi:hypothetical protein